MRIMSYNLRYDNVYDGENRWDNRKEMVVSTIKFHHGDIIGMQEGLYHMVQYLEENLTDYAYVGVGREDGKKEGEFNPIFYRKDKFTLLDWGTFWLSETPELVSKGWDGGCFRLVTVAKFVENDSKKEFYMFNTHLDNSGEVARVEGAELLVSRIKTMTSGKNTVVTGDFNCTEEEAPYKIMTRDGELLKDAMYVSKNPHHGPTYTFKEDGEMLERGTEDNKIDYVFIGEGMECINHGIIGEKWDKRYSSDHFPIAVDLEII